MQACFAGVGGANPPDATAAIDQVTEVCRRVGMPLGIFGMNPAVVRPYLEWGYTLIVCSVDTVLLGTAARELLSHATRRSPQARIDQYVAK